ncbi:MAG: lipase family protein [Stenotrophobium sp.]
MKTATWFCNGAASALLVLALAGCGAGSSVSAANGGAAGIPFPPNPDPDPFYKQPDPMPTLPPGTILDSRSVNFAPAGAPLPNKAWQLKFISTDVNGQPIAAVATVVMPLVPIAPTPELVSWQFAEDALGSQCAPSHAMTGSIADYVIVAETASALAMMTANGWTLVIPDHEGPYSEYAAGRLAGQITLDGIRAAENFAPLGLDGVKTPVGMSGYSGGAIATSWAASLQSTYAPELNIIGAASGGTPAEMVSVIHNIDSNLVSNTAFFSLIFSAVEGVNRAYPRTVTPVLNAKGVAAFKAMANGCAGATTGGAATPTGQTSDYTTTPTPLETPDAKVTLAKVSLPQPTPEVPVIPMFLYHSQLDELIPIAGTTALVDAWCKDGVTVSYFQAPTGEHVATEAADAPFVLAYLLSRFRGLPTVTPPGTVTCN